MISPTPWPPCPMHIWWYDDDLHAATFTYASVAVHNVRNLGVNWLTTNLVNPIPPPPLWCDGPYWARASSCRGFTITLWHTTFGRTPLGEWSARRRDLYLTRNKILKRQTAMPPGGIEPAIPANERPKTHALDRAASGIGTIHITQQNPYYMCVDL
jgi:hypothetical protein